eukprot:TRINITY_DN1309_c0_g1_i1.p1 TRINITY_DN1309_c0_g1~~TRINITY_DN1309_c0_g1_i1.p1  ORF type:complete len:57 (+),score=10.56 TRINITY_DN1309_c0_g1_i1:49-219(+)
MDRLNWDRGVSGMQGFVESWPKLGIVIPMPGRDDFRVFVESERDELWTKKMHLTQS